MIWRAALLALGAATGANVASACEVKLVFERWCLGAPIEPQLQGVAVQFDQAVRGQRRIGLEQDGRRIMISVFDDRVADVSRAHKPGTALVYLDLLNSLTRIYGEGIDRSYFPRYANTWDRRQLAIEIGEGRASRRWRQEGFTVALSWANRDAVLLIYSHTALTDAARKSKPSDL